MQTKNVTVMKSTFKILFYLKKNEPKKNGHVVIMVRITVDGDQVQFSSKLDVHPDNWDTKIGRAVVNKQSAEKKENLRVSSLNKTLDEIRAAITMHYTRMMNTDGYALPEKIRNAFLGLEEKDKTLISYFTQHNEQYAKKVGKTATQKTYSRYELTKQRMIEFLKSEYNISDIPIKEITVTHIENFYLYLREQCEVSNNTAMKFVQRFHTILLFAQKSGLSFLDPFNNFRFNFDKTDRGQLRQDRPGLSDAGGNRHDLPQGVPIETLGTGTRRLHLQLLYRFAVLRHLYADRRRHPNRGGRQEVDYEGQGKDRSGIAYPLAAYPVGNTCQIRRQDKKR